MRTTVASDLSYRTLYKPLDWALVRIPLLPIESYLWLSEKPKEIGETNAYAAVSHLMATDSTVQAALTVASISFADALERSSYPIDNDSRIARVLLRYLIRMSTRPTPYGLFAGVGMVRWGSRTDLALDGIRPRTRMRPDMAWLLGFVFEAESQLDIRRHLSYTTNSSAVTRAGRIFVSNLPLMADSAESVPRVSVRATDVVQRALSFARSPIPHRQLVSELTVSSGATEEKVEKLINELWRQGLLLTDLRPPLTDGNPAEYVVKRLKGIPDADRTVGLLEKTLAAMTEWDELPLEKTAPAYRLFPAASGERNRAWMTIPPQVDMSLPLKGCQLNQAVAMEAARAADVLVRLSPLPYGLPHIAAYRREFNARFGHEREVSLLELLHPEFGLGPPFARLDDYSAAPDTHLAAERDQALLGLAVDALRDRKMVVDLDAEFLSKIEAVRPTDIITPDSLELSVFVLAASTADVDAGHFQLVVGPNLGASAAGKTLGRFVDLIGDAAAKALKEIAILDSEMRPGVILAEMVYLPQAPRSANIAVRPHFRPYEIVVGTSPGVPPEQVIPLDELVVGTRAGRFYIRWPVQDVEVITCAGHMLNNMEAPDICRFLEDVRLDAQVQFSSFDWGHASGLPVLPRVQMGQVILSLARWRVDAPSRMAIKADSLTTFMHEMDTWRRRWQVPRYVYLSHYDNRLLIDLENEALVNELRLELVRAQRGAKPLLEEALPGPNHAWVPGVNGHFITELVVPLFKQFTGSPVAPASARAVSVHGPAVADRLRAPGSDWLFVKIYCPITFEEEILTGTGADFCQHATDSGVVDDWFFIRYSDPEQHLRLRFRGASGRLIATLLPQLCAWCNDLIRQGVCTRFCFDTYDRELERYGGPEGMTAAEAIFGADSRAVIRMLRLVRRGLLTIDRTSLAVLSTDDLLGSLGSSEAERLGWCREVLKPMRGARNESRKRDTLNPVLASGQEHRQRKALLRKLLGDSQNVRNQPGGDALMRIFAARGKELSKVRVRLDTLIHDGTVYQTRSDLLRSYVHLHCNRLLGRERAIEEHVFALLESIRYGLNQAPLQGKQSGGDEAVSPPSESIIQ